MRQSEVIEAFVRERARTDHPGIRIESSPDESNRTTADIDAVAGPLAIEHTTFDSLANQRCVADWFDEAVGRIEQELSLRDFRLRVLVSYDSVVIGQDWSGIRRAIRTWIEHKASALGDGIHRGCRIPDVPFLIDVEKRSDQPPALIIIRSLPSDDSLESRLRAAIIRKGKKLERYAREGKIRVLLLENDDIALMSDSVIRAALVGALEGPGLPAIDELWYGDTTIPSEIRFVNFSDCLNL